MFLGNEAPWFSFLVHPRHLGDLNTLSGASVLRRYSSDDEEFVTRATTTPALVAGDVRFEGSAIRGEIIGVVRMPWQILSVEGHQAIVEGAKLAAARGSSVIGLGALTGPVTRGGETLVPQLPSDVTVTNGNGYTAALSVRNVKDACEARGLTNPKIAVLGCTGSVGVAASRLLTEDGYEPILIGRLAEKVDQLLGDLAGRARLTDEVSAVAEANVVLVLTNHPTAHLEPRMLLPECVVVDVSQPANVVPEDLPAFAERGIVVHPGAIARIPGYSCTQEFSLPTPADTFACLAETYILAREGIREHSIGRPSAKYARDVEELARHHGVIPRPLDETPLDVAASSEDAAIPVPHP